MPADELCVRDVVLLLSYFVRGAPVTARRVLFEESLLRRAGWSRLEDGLWKVVLPAGFPEHAAVLHVDDVVRYAAQRADLDVVAACAPTTALHVFGTSSSAPSPPHRHLRLLEGGGFGEPSALGARARSDA
jgi:hypothetical protein